ncbi:MAG TPA: hypothetical protein VEB40_12230 [Flavipsychrobacter sp.]|nr:hypothetical protein [Flavipsychrobacter sp.]
MQTKDILMKAYSSLPCLCLASLAICILISALAWDGISWQNTPGAGLAGYERFTPFIDFIIFPTVAGLLFLPVLLLVQLIRKRRISPQMKPALFSYGLFLAFLVLAVYMDWWID